MPSRSSSLASQAQAIADRAFDEGRELTAAERDKAHALLARARETHDIEAKLRELDGAAYYEHGDRAGGGGYGDQFIESKGYKDLVARGFGAGA